MYIWFFSIFPYWGIGGNPPTSQKFAHSPRTWNNFLPPTKVSSLPLNGQMHSSSDAYHLIKNSTPSKISHSLSTRGDFLSPPFNTIWKTLISDISRVFFGTPLITKQVTSYMLHADSHLID